MAVGALACSTGEPSTTPSEVRSDGGALDSAEGSAPDEDRPSGDASSDAPTGSEPVVLFDGTLTNAWQMSTIANQPGQDDPGSFTVENGALVAHPGTDLGLFWSSVATPSNFLLELEWMLSAADDNSGIFVRFPDPSSKGYNNTAWVAVDFGFEIQINEPGVPDGAPRHTTGAIYGQASQTFSRVVARPPGQWNEYAIRVEGNEYAVTLNGQQVTRYTNPIATRGVPSAPGAPAFIGLQTHTGNVAFRNIRLRPL